MMRRVFIAMLMAVLLHSCFTGIESTKPITKADVSKQHIQVTPEQKFLEDIASDKVSDWSPGKKFRVTDSRIGLVIGEAGNNQALAGSDIAFVSVTPALSLNGEEVAVFNFTDCDGSPLAFKSTYDYKTVGDRADVDIPFTVDLAVVDTVRARLVGNRYYITTPLWYDAEGNGTVPGLRHVPVDVVDVVPGDAVYPLRVVFSYTDDAGDSKLYSVYITYGDSRAATRNFDTLMSFTDPRIKYPNISLDVWKFIVHSQVREGMTKTECRLALGQPKVYGERPTTAGMVEYWSYSDGIYLLFEDGYLTTFRR